MAEQKVKNGNNEQSLGKSSDNDNNNDSTNHGKWVDVKENLITTDFDNGNNGDKNVNCSGINDVPNTPTTNTTSFTSFSHLSNLKSNHNSTDSNNSNSNSNSNTLTKYSAKKWLHERGYELRNKVAVTLQGSVYEAIDINSKDIVIVKRTDMRLHESKLAYINGKSFKCDENIIKEKEIMQYLQTCEPPKFGFLKMIDFDHDNYNYFLITEHGGKQFKKHVLQCHRLISKNKLGITEFKRHCKVISYQIISYINWLHSLNVCHMDISIENILIKNAKLKHGKFSCDGTIYFCDYGLSEKFDNNGKPIKCRKFNIGKPQYKSREVYKEIEFNPKLNDCWSFAVVLFIIIIGAKPFERPSYVDKAYNQIMSGHLEQMLINTKKDANIDNASMDLILRIFVKESKRLDSKAILRHKYFRNIVYATKTPIKRPKSTNDIPHGKHSKNNNNNNKNNKSKGVMSKIFGFYG